MRTGESRRSSQGRAFLVYAAYAADAACHIDWALLTATGRVESNHARFGGNQLDSADVAQPGIIGIALDGMNGTAQIMDTDRGRPDRDTVYDRAVGPMQFIPSTWRVADVDANGDGVKNPRDMAIADAYRHGVRALPAPPAHRHPAPPTPHVAKVAHGARIAAANVPPIPVTHAAPTLPGRINRIPTCAPSRLSFVNDPSVADWIAPRLDPFGGWVGSVVPRGFPSSTRVLHPVRHHDEESATWSTVCARTGRVAPALMQWQSSGVRGSRTEQAVRRPAVCRGTAASPWPSSGLWGQCHRPPRYRQLPARR